MARKEKSGERDPQTFARYAAIIRREVQRLERTIQQTLYSLLMQRRSVFF